MRAAIYLRQSKDPKDDKLAISRQREDCEALCEARGWTWVEYPDNDRSASNGKPRPAYDRMLTDIKAGLINAVVTWDLDRLHRKPIELEQFITLADEKGLALATVGGETDLSTDGGRLFARIKGAVAKAEVERKSARQKRANQQHRESGAWNNAGQRPFGYTKDGVPLEPEATMVRKAVRDILTGKSLRSISVEWNRRGVTTTRGSTWSNLQLRRVIMNPLYAGLVTYEGEIVPGVVGQWETLWDVDTHRGLVAFLSDPTRKPALAFERKHIGSGVYRCGECGGKLYAGRPHGQKVTYMCRDYHVARIAAPIDELVEITMLAYLAEHAVGGDLRQSEEQVDLDALRTQRDALTATKGQLATLLRKGVLDVPAVERESKVLSRQIADINACLAEAAQSHPAIALLEDGEDPELLADEELLLARWTKATPDTKGKIVAELLVVTVHRAPRGQRRFDPSLVEIRWR